jgi:hypothetical protein
MHKNISEDVMIDDLATVLTGMVERMSFIFNSALKGQPSNGPWVFGLNVARVKDETYDVLTTDEIEGLSITGTMRLLYRYGVNGEYPEGWHINDIVMNGIDFIESVRGGLRSSINNHHGEGSGMCGEVVDRAVARWKLDGSEQLSFREVALLAGLDERTVRNAASSKGKGRLKTENFDGKTFVNATTAYAWLARKKGFKPTTYEKENAQMEASEFSNVDEFCVYLHRRRLELSLSCEEAGRSVDLLLGEDGWVLMENSGAAPDLKHIPGLATTLQVDEAWLTQRIMEVFYARQLKLITEKERGEPTSDRPAKKGRKK